MKKTVQNRIAVCGLVLCAFLAGCRSDPEETLLIGSGDGEEVPSPQESVKEEISQWEWGSGETPGQPVQTPAEDPLPQMFRVYVCGAVKEPGVVSLPQGSIAEDALLAAGGFSENAWRDYVNLAERVTDGEKLYFPSLDERDSWEETADQAAVSGAVNINTADAALLCTLPGIGESKAGDIIAYREKNGNFATKEDIMKVPGIKESVYEKISDKITVK